MEMQILLLGQRSFNATKPNGHWKEKKGIPYRGENGTEDQFEEDEVCAQKE